MLKVLCSNALDAVMRELVPEFERASGHTVSVDYKSTNQILDLVRGGTNADLLVAGREAMAALAREDRIAADGRADLASSAIGVCVRAGAPKPDLSSVEAFKRALLGAKSIAHTATGQSGSYFAALTERLGIAAEVKAKAIVPAGGIIGELVARGEAELGIQQISEMLAVSGVELAGPLPAAIQKVTVFSAGVRAGSGQAAAAQALVRHLASPSAAALMKTKGLEPVVR